jgi:hypothetical protein
MTDTVIDIPPEKRVAFAARNLRTLVVDGFLLVRQLGGAKVVDKAAIDIITTAAAILGGESGDRRVLEALDKIRRLHDPRSPEHWRRQR